MQILLKALENRAGHGRDNVLPKWRCIAIQRFDQTPAEIETVNAPEVATPAFGLSTMMTMVSAADIHNRASSARANLATRLEAARAKDPDFGSSRQVDPEMFIRLGFVWVGSRPKLSKADSEEVAKDWRNKGFEVFVHCQTGDGADLYELQAVNLIPKFAKKAQLDHLPSDSNRGIVFGTIEAAIPDEKIAAEAWKEVDTAFQTLESEGLVVRVQGVNMGARWQGISLSHEGLAVAKDMKFRLRQQSADDAKPKGVGPFHVCCPNCKQVFMKTTDMYTEDSPVHGYMLEFLPQYKKLKWSLPFMPSAIGQNITCPGCSCVLTGTNNRFLDGILTDPNEEEKADIQPDESTGGKIDDEALLKMVDEGKPQTEIARFFQVSKQAVNKKLKALREAV